MKSIALLVALSAVFTCARADEPRPAAEQPKAEEAKAEEAKAEEAKPVEKASETSVVTEAQIKQMRGRGYKPVNRNGTLVFCRSEGQIGTHFERTRCNTIDELKQAELSGKEYVNSIQQQGSPTPFKGP